MGRPQDMWEDQGPAFQMEVLWTAEYRFMLIKHGNPSPQGLLPETKDYVPASVTHLVSSVLQRLRFSRRVPL